MESLLLKRMGVTCFFIGGITCTQATEMLTPAFKEIIVTAQKRGEQTLAETPISIGVLSEENFEVYGIRDLSEIINTVGGVNLYSNAPGQSTISVRGAGNDAILAGGTTTGLYLDEVPFGFTRSSILPDVGIYDLERVEVLRGPQGTLYGTSSLNGVVRVLTKDANLENVEIKSRINGSSTNEGGENFSGDVAVNFPVIPGQLAVRGVVSYADYSGWVDTTSSNIIDGVAADDINSSQTGNYRLKMNALPTENLDIEMSVWLSRTEADAPSRANKNTITPMSKNQPQDQEFDVYSLEVDYDFGDFSMLSATGFSEITQDSVNDIALSGVTPTTIATDFYASEAFSQEVRFASSLSGVWQWTAGVSYRDTEEQLIQSIPSQAPGEVDATDESESWAVFGEVTRSLFDEKAEITVGLRYYNTTITLKETENLSFRRPLINVEEDFDDISPRIVLNYHPGDDLTVYSSISKGFRSGLLQAPGSLAAEPGLEALVEPDTLWNYEAGAKGRLLNGRFTYETALYYVDWDDVQQKFITAAGTAAVLNTETVTGFGFDANISSQPIEGMTLALAVGWNGLEFDEAVSSNGVTAFNEGDRLNQSPEYTAGFSVDYEFAIPGAHGLRGRIGSLINYYSELEQRALVLGAQQISESDEIFNARLNATVEAKQWTAMLYVDNATNEDGVTLAPSATYLTGTQLRPRTLGIQCTYEY